MPNVASPATASHVYSGATPDEAWKQVYAALTEARERASGLKTPVQFSTPPPPGEYMFGLNIPAVVRLMELLPGVCAMRWRAMDGHGSALAQHAVACGVAHLRSALPLPTPVPLSPHRQGPGVASSSALSTAARAWPVSSRCT